MEHLVQGGVRNADTGVGNGEPDLGRAAGPYVLANPDRHPAMIGELHGVADQVEQDLPQPPGVAPQPITKPVIHENRQADTLALCLIRQKGHGVFD